MSIFDDILKKYGDYEEDWDEETQKNWDEKMSDPLGSRADNLSSEPAQVEQRMRRRR